MNRRQILKSIFVAPIAALLGTKFVSDAPAKSETKIVEYDEIRFGTMWVREDGKIEYAVKYYGRAE